MEYNSLLKTAAEIDSTLYSYNIVLSYKTVDITGKKYIDYKPLSVSTVEILNVCLTFPDKLELIYNTCGASEDIKVEAVYLACCYLGKTSDYFHYSLRDIVQSYLLRCIKISYMMLDGTQIDMNGEIEAGDYYILCITTKNISNSLHSVLREDNNLGIQCLLDYYRPEWQAETILKNNKRVKFGM